MIHLLHHQSKNLILRRKNFGLALESKIKKKRKNQTLRQRNKQPKLSKSGIFFKPALSALLFWAQSDSLMPNLNGKHYLLHIYKSLDSACVMKNVSKFYNSKVCGINLYSMLKSSTVGN